MLSAMTVLMVVMRPSLTMCPIALGKISIKNQKVCIIESVCTHEPNIWLVTHVRQCQGTGREESPLTLGFNLEVHHDGVAEQLDEARDVGVEGELGQLFLF